MNERRFLQANIDEGGLHTGHHAYDLAVEDITHVPAMVVTLDENLLQQTILDKRHSSLHRCHVDENFFTHSLFHYRRLVECIGTENSASNCAVSNRGSPITPL